MLRKFIIVFSLLYAVLAAGCSSIDWEREIIALFHSSPPKHFDFEHFQFVNDAPAKFSNVTTLKWKAPSTNVDGTPLKDLTGYKVFYGQGSGYHSKPIDAGEVPGITIYNLAPGKWCFAVKAYDMYRNSSGFSNEKCKHID